MKYFIGFRKQFYYEVEVEAETKEQAEAIAWSRLPNSERYGQDVVIDHIDTEEGEEIA